MNQRRERVGPTVVALAVCLLGAVAIVDATRVGAGVGYSPVGPAVFPVVVGGGLLALGLLMLVRVWVRPDRDLLALARDAGATTDWPTTLRLGGLLVVYAVALGYLGYVLATAALVPAGARVLGSRGLVRDLLIGLGLGLVVYLAFTQLLGVRLPAGPLDVVLP